MNLYKIKTMQMWQLCGGAEFLVWNYHLPAKIKQGSTIPAANSGEEAKGLKTMNKVIHDTWK